MQDNNTVARNTGLHKSSNTGQGEMNANNIININKHQSVDMTSRTLVNRG